MKMPASVIHNISQYFNANGQFRVFAKLNHRTRKDLSIFSNNSRILTIDLRAKHQFPVLTDQQYQQMISFTQHFRFKLNDGKYSDKISANEALVCKYIQIFLEKDIERYTFSLHIEGGAKKYDRLMTMLTIFNKLHKFEIENIKNQEMLYLNNSLAINSSELTIKNGTQMFYSDFGLMNLKILRLYGYKDKQNGMDILNNINRDTLETLELSNNCVLICQPKLFSDQLLIKSLKITDSSIFNGKIISTMEFIGSLQLLANLTISIEQAYEIETKIIPALKNLKNLEQLHIAIGKDANIQLMLQKLLSIINIIKFNHNQLTYLEVNLSRLILDIPKTKGANMFNESLFESIQGLGMKNQIKLVGAFNRENGNSELQFQCNGKQNLCKVTTKSITAEYYIPTIHSNLML